MQTRSSNPKPFCIANHLVPGRAVLVVLVALLLCSRSSATERVIGEFPNTGVSGVAVKVSVPQTITVGLCPVQVTIRPRGAVFPAERRLTIQLMPRSNPVTPSAFDFQQQIVLPEGARNVQQTLHVPVQYLWWQCRVRVLEDDVPLEGYDSASLPPIILRPNQRLLRNQRTRHVMGIVEARTQDTNPEPAFRFPDTRVIRIVMGLDTGAQASLGPTPADFHLSHQGAKTDALATRLSDLKIRLLHEDRLAEDWLNYCQYDFLLASSATLQRIGKDNPQAWEAIRSWLSCGGMLWCYGPEPAESLNSLFRDETAWEVPVKATLDGASKRTFTQQELQEQVLSRYNEATSGLFSRYAAATPEYAPEELKRLLRSRFYLAGKVIYIHNESPFPGTLAQWNACRIMSQDRLGMSNRMGLDLRRGDNAFWEWLIGEVGQPPVYTFLIVITLFALLVGPVSYYSFLYLKRLYLFFVFAPVVAVICSIGIACYAVLADGFGTRTRIRHVTLLNAAGDATVWSRQTYFAGMRPRDGALWPSDCEVIPVWAPHPVARMENSLAIEPADSQITFGESGWQFEGQFMPSRRQTQFIAIRPQRNAGTVKASLDGDAVRIQNDLQHHLQSILFVDGQGDYWLGEDIAAGSAVTATPLNPLESANRITSLYLDHVPQLPPGYQDASKNKWLNMGASRTRRRIRFTTYNLGGIAEKEVRNYLVENKTPVPGTFIGVAELPDVIAVDGASAIESIHLVLGPIDVDVGIRSRFNGRPASEFEGKESSE